MSETRIPIGEVESQRLEFKAAAALEKPERIAREVVGMLNAEGGEVWIGIHEDEGRAVGLDLIPNVERARERLHDSLVDSLSPSPDHLEVKIAVMSLPDSGDRGLLYIDVAPRQERGPYALAKGGSYTFVVRIGSRLRPLGREEIFGGHDSLGEASLREAKEKISEEKQGVNVSGESVLWLRVQPAPSLEIDPQSPLFEGIAYEPPESGNRRSGWNFAQTKHRPEVSSEGVEWGIESPYRRHVTFRGDGSATFVADLTKLGNKGEQLWPIALLEYPVSGLRIARTVFQELKQIPQQVVVALMLSADEELTLREGTPGLYFKTGDEYSLDGREVFVQLDFSGGEFLDNPDRCGFRLLRQIYQAFGIREEGMPDVFDRKTGRLILPE